MKSAEQWFDEYGESHQNPTNKLIHWFCVPPIAFSAIGMLWAIPHPYFDGVLPGIWEPFLNWGTIAMALGLLFYIRLSLTLAVGILAFEVVVAIGNNALATVEALPLWATSLIVFAVAWVGQFIGHHIEGKKPSFFKDLQFLLIGPAWLMQFLYKRAGIPI